MTQESLGLVKRLLEGAIEGEMLEQLRLGRYRRSEVRQGYRNGYRQGSLLTKLGLVEHIRVPRDREGHYQPTALPRYKGRQEEVNRLVREMFLQRVSTRKSREGSGVPVGGRGKPSDSISNHQKPGPGGAPLPHSSPGRPIPAPAAGWHQLEAERMVLCTYSISLQGKREMISFRQASAEGEASGKPACGTCMLECAPDIVCVLFPRTI